jgi:hypothetical protein
MRVEQVERLLSHCTSEDGSIDVDTLVVPLLGVSHLQESAKEHGVIRAEQRPDLETFLSELQVAPEEIRRLVAGAITSGGDLDVECLVEGLRKVKPKLTSERFVEVCRKRGINVQPHELKIEKDTGQKPVTAKQPDVRAAFSAMKPNTPADPRVTKAGNDIDYRELPAASVRDERLEMASRFRHEGARPEQVKRLLERLAGHARPVQEMHSEVEGQALRTDQDIQSLLARLQPRTLGHQVKNGEWARPGKTMPEPLIQAGSDRSPGPADPKPAATAATQVAATLVESQQNIQEEMLPSFQVKRLQTAIGTEHGSKPAEGKGTVSGAVTSIAAQTTAAARELAVLPSTSSSSQSPTPSIEPLFQVAQRFVTMAGNGESRTRLNLHPPELGRIQIEISLESNKLSATLLTETQVVKELMEAHLGQLRQHLAQHNLQLESFQVTVGADASAYKESNGELFGNGKHSRQSEVAEPAADLEQEFRVAYPSHALEGSGRIDLFA